MTGLNDLRRAIEARNAHFQGGGVEALVFVYSDSTVAVDQNHRVVAEVPTSALRTKKKNLKTVKDIDWRALNLDTLVVDRRGETLASGINSGEIRDAEYIRLTAVIRSSPFVR